MNCPYNYDEPEFRLEWFEVRLAELQLEKDALWVKTQEDEREINDLRDVNKQLREEIEKLKELHTLNFMSDMLPMEKLQKQRDNLMKALKHLVIIAQKDEINKDHLDVTLRKARNVIADIDPTVEKCDCCY
jgi:hypothetical protein